ncbi:MAG: hypothetical protein ACFFAM_11105 [Promethearchaeota archaeon]
MRTLTITQRSFCPFRTLLNDFQAGCVVQMGKDTLCYSQDARPLLYQNDHCYCPFIDFSISSNNCQDLERILAPILEIQDEESTGFSVWPLLSKNSFIWKHKSVTNEGKEMEKLIENLRNDLEEVIFNIS